ncbi:hypothetical protein ABBQ32_008793 [Trebouxia sp. C0010 RCD-2024]
MQQQRQAAKGSAPLAFQLSSPTKLVKQNVLAGTRPQLNGKQDAAKEISAAVKARAKKSRWGPDQLVTSTPPTTSHAYLPASGFKGVNSHRPPGALLSSRPGTSAGSAAAKQALEKKHAADTQLGHPSFGPHCSLAAEQAAAQTLTTAQQPAAKTLVGTDNGKVEQRSSHVQRGKDEPTGLVSGERAYPAFTANRSNLSSAQDKDRVPAQHRTTSPAEGAVVPLEHVEPSSIDSRHPEAQPRAASNEAAHQEPAKRPLSKHTSRSSDESKHQRQHQVSEGRRQCISPATSDGQHHRSQEHRSSKGSSREGSESKASNPSEAREAYRSCAARCGCTYTCDGAMCVLEQETRQPWCTESGVSGV